MQRRGLNDTHENPRKVYTLRFAATSLGHVILAHSMINEQAFSFYKRTGFPIIHYAYIIDTKRFFKHESRLIILARKTAAFSGPSSSHAEGSPPRGYRRSSALPLDIQLRRIITPIAVFPIFRASHN